MSMQKCTNTFRKPTGGKTLVKSPKTGCPVGCVARFPAVPHIKRIERKEPSCLQLYCNTTVRLTPVTEGKQKEKEGKLIVQRVTDQANDLPFHWRPGERKPASHGERRGGCGPTVSRQQWTR